MTDDIRLDGGRLVELIDAALSADYPRVRRLGSDLAQTCLEQGDQETAKRLRAFMRRKGVPLQVSGAQSSLPVDSASRLPLIDEEPWPGTPVMLNEQAGAVINRFLDDIHNAQRLFDGGLLTRFGLMLSGPPGTGKTLLAGHVASQIRKPFFVARLDSLISSRLGDTAKNIRQIFEFASADKGVLFLDELDAVAKMRDDRNELGELKRVVNTVIQGLDSLDDQAVVIGATNHPQLLDPAIWRRFPYRCDVDLPNVDTRIALWRHFLYQGDTKMDQRSTILAAISEGFSGADIENLSLATRRLALLNEIDLPEPQLLWALMKSREAGIQFPEVRTLGRAEIRSLVRQLVRFDGIHKTDLSAILRITRQMLYRFLKDDLNE
jgi:ATPase family associated with various cellular activities (AAA)